jgi:TolA-binding protein
MSKKSWTAALYVVLVFAAGVTAGVLGSRVYGTPGVSAKTNSPQPPSEWRKKHIAEMQTRLKLSEQQVLELNQALDRTKDQYRQIRERTKPEMERVFHEQVERITAMLTPEQRPEYERIVEEHERQRKLREAGAR